MFLPRFFARPERHCNPPTHIRKQSADTDRGVGALIADLKQHGLLEDTLVVWGGEFGRTVYSQGTLTKDNYGRDHHPRNFCMWMAGGGIKPGISFGETDDFSYNIVEAPVHLNELNATILHCMGIDHTPAPFETTFGLADPGSAISIWVVVRIDDGNERASDKVVVQHPE